MTYLGRTRMTVFLSTALRKVTDRKLKNPIIRQLKNRFFKCILLSPHSDSRHVFTDYLSWKESEHLLDNQIGPNRTKHLGGF